MPQAPAVPLDASRLAADGATVERSYRVAEFARLADRLANTEGEVRARLEFRLQGGVPTARLEVRAALGLICQRCLEPLRQGVESTSLLAFVERDRSTAPGDCEVVVGDPRHVDFASLVEDELLLGLPLVAMHGRGDHCAARKPTASDRAGPPPQTAATRRPFAGLRDLLKH